MANEWFCNKTIKTAEIDGYGITLTFEDGGSFRYDASDGGYSSWECKDGTGKNKNEVITKYHIVQQKTKKDGKNGWILVGVEYDNLKFALKDLAVQSSVMPQNVYRLAKKTETKWKVVKDED